MLDSIVNNNFLFPLIVSIIICVCYYVYNQKYNTEEIKPTTTTYVKLFISSLSLLIGVSYIVGSNTEDNFDLFDGSNLSNILPNFSNKNTQETLENTKNEQVTSNTSNNVITPNNVYNLKKTDTLNNNIKETTIKEATTNENTNNNTGTNTKAGNQEDFSKTTKFTESNNDQRILNVDSDKKLLNSNSVKKIEKFLTGNPDF